jgi:hypothetical protein
MSAREIEMAKTKTTYSVEIEGQVLTIATTREVTHAVVVKDETGWSIFAVAKRFELAVKTMNQWKLNQPTWTFKVIEAKQA